MRIFCTQCGAAGGAGNGGGRSRGAAGGGGGSDFTQPLTRAEQSALENYTGNAFAAINARMRGQQRSLDPYLRDIKRKVSNALDKASLNRQRLVFRGVGDKALYAQVAGGKLKAGTTLSERGFLSTTTRRKTADTFAKRKDSPVVFRILAPKGAKGARLDSRSSNSLEREVLFQSGRRFTVVKSRIRNGVAEITVRMKR